MEQEFKKILRVLVIENNPLDSRLLKSMLAKSSFGEFDTVMTATLRHAFELLSQREFDAVLLDLNLDDSTGLDSLNTLHAKFPKVAIVVNTGSYRESTGLKAVSSGAQDYLIKGKYKAYGLVKSLYYAVERKRVEEELKLAYLNLKEAQTQLIQAEKMNVIGGLASGIAHEVKNPLATILYGVEFLHTKIPSVDEQVAFTLKSIKEAAIRANEIIKDLLDFASLSNLDRQLEDIHKVVERALLLTQHQADKQNIKIQKDFSPDLPLISIDRNRIQQVIVDLVLNAIGAIQNNGTITIRTYKKNYTAEDNAVFNLKEQRIRIGDAILVMDVEDTGSGIREELLTRIFDPFFTTRRTTGGVGLGLSVARTIMLNHDGLIALHNRRAGGAVARMIFKC